MHGDALRYGLDKVSVSICAKLKKCLHKSCKVIMDKKKDRYISTILRLPFFFYCNYRIQVIE